MQNESLIICGAGGISNAWLPGIVQEKLQVAAIVDLRIEAAEAQIDKYQLAGAKAYSSLDEALSAHAKDANFLLDLTIPDAHSKVTVAALNAGLHVIGEKPMAATLEQARAMADASETTGKLYMCSQSRRWDTNHATLRQAIASNTIGKLTTLCCDFFMGCHFGGFRDEMASPLILDMAIHHFDQARFFSGLDPVAVYCEEFNPHGSWYKGDVSATCIFEMTGGVRFTYRGSWCAEGFHTSWNGDWRIIGERGTAIYAADQRPVAEVIAADTADFTKPKIKKELPVVTVEPTGMHGALHEMLRFLRTGEMPQTHAADNIKSLAMVLSAIESSRLGKRIAIEI